MLDALPHKKGNLRAFENDSFPHNLGNRTKRAKDMRNESKREYLKEIRERYFDASRTAKAHILNEFCKVCGYNRKYAIRLLNSTSKKNNFLPSKSRGRPKIYDDLDLFEFLKTLWESTNYICSKRLKASIPFWLPHYEVTFNVELSEKTKYHLLNISHSTIERLLAPLRSKFMKIGLSTTKPGTILKKQIPIKTDQWDETVPGYLEADTVAHCGNSVVGMYVHSVNTVDIATGWTEQRAVWGKGETGVLKAIKHIEQSLPFKLKGFDSDNGGEFLNWHLLKYLQKRKRPVQYTRSREYHKNDNAHIEGKNWTHIRQYLGYHRFDDFSYVELLNALYTTEWRLYFNFFIPSVKLLEKKRVGSSIKKKHDLPKTPFKRVLEAAATSRNVKQQLHNQYQNLNPFLLLREMKKKINSVTHYRLNHNLLKSKNIKTYYLSDSLNQSINFENIKSKLLPKNTNNIKVNL